MAWRPRILGEGLCYHVRCQCNNRAFRLHTHEDFEQFLMIVLATRTKYRFLFHHFALMQTHIHLILSTPGPIFLDRIMHRINHHYAMAYHRRHHRRGHFWMHGYRSSVIDTDAYALACMRYGDRNAIRAGLVTHPSDWPWCAYSYYAHGSVLLPLDPHRAYLGLAATREACQAWYREFVESLLPSDEVREREFIHSGLHRYLNTRKT